MDSAETNHHAQLPLISQTLFSVKKEPTLKTDGTSRWAMVAGKSLLNEERPIIFAYDQSPMEYFKASFALRLTSSLVSIMTKAFVKVFYALRQFMTNPSCTQVYPDVYRL